MSTQPINRKSFDLAPCQVAQATKALTMDSPTATVVILSPTGSLILSGKDTLLALREAINFALGAPV